MTCFLVFSGFYDRSVRLPGLFIRLVLAIFSSAFFNWASGLFSAVFSQGYQPVLVRKPISSYMSDFLDPPHFTLPKRLGPMRPLVFPLFTEEKICILREKIV
jgi:hypothetical protein